MNRLIHYNIFIRAVKLKENLCSTDNIQISNNIKDQNNDFIGFPNNLFDFLFGLRTCILFNITDIINIDNKCIYSFKILNLQDISSWWPKIRKLSTKAFIP